MTFETKCSYGSLFCWQFERTLSFVEIDKKFSVASILQIVMLVLKLEAFQNQNHFDQVTRKPKDAFLPLFNQKSSDSRNDGKLWCFINFRPENLCSPIPCNRSQMAVLRHNKYEKRRSFSFDFIAFLLRCLGLPPCHEDGWRRNDDTAFLLQ